MLLEFASTNDELPVLLVTLLADVEKWAKGVGDHALRKVRFLEAPCQRLFQNGADIHCLPLQAGARPLARPRIVGGTTCRAQRDRIVIALTDPTIFDFDLFSKLDEVLTAQAQAHVALLLVFLSTRLDILHA
ncbi:hypothetical protein BJY52DRAFT_1197832 [Lactarius psammicola]|nr:hypothetical protein BJY52DRAFT_1197832 [Lactarius psammicola]